MNRPQSVSARSLRRLRRRYTWLMLALGAPVLAALVYALSLHFQMLESGAQRQLVVSVERRVAQLDAALGRMREDLMRLAETVRAPGLTMSDVQVDKQSLKPGAHGAYTLDALPMLLRDRAPQVLLVGPAWRNPARRGSSVERAALFAEQARLAMLRDGRFSRVTYVDVEAGEAWIYPWVASDRWLAELSAKHPEQVARLLARQAGVPEGRVATIEGEARWYLREGPDGQRLLTLAISLGSESGQRLVAADVPLAAFHSTMTGPGTARFWVVDAEGQVVMDQVTRGRSSSQVMGASPLRFAPESVAAALAAPVAQEIGASVVAARSSGIAPWTGFLASDSADLRGGVLRDMWPHLVGGTALLIMFLAIAAFIWRHFGQPSLRLVDYLHRQTVEKNAAEPKVPDEWVPWLHLTRDTFSAWREAAAREQRSEALKSAIVDHALAAVVATDAHGVIVEFNPAAQRMFSRTREEMIGRPAVGTIFPESLRSIYLEDLRRLRRGDPPLLFGRRMETIALRPDGTEFAADMVVWRTRVGEETFVTASLFDISELRAASQVIERQRDALRQSEKLAAMGSLLAGVAHELNNPLAIVMGRASLLEDKCTDPALVADAVRIREAAERCGRIVRTFLAMARSQPAVRAPVQLNDLVRGAVDLLQYSLRTTGVTLEQKLHPDLPAVVADPDKLGQVLLNLIVNAQQALSQVEPPRQMCVETGRSDDGVWMRVADNGAGVPEASRERIFEAFVTSKAEGMGTGLGLAVSRSVAIEHGGGLVLEPASPFGRGASFRLDLPLRATVPEPATVPAAAEPPVSVGVSGRVLVIDDEPELAAMMRDALEAAGYEVVTAESGAVALALLDEGRFDIVVSDLRMPDIDGRALWRAIAEHDRELARRFVFVTGDTLSPLANEFRRESGADGLEKPFSAAELVQRVRRCGARAAPQ